MNAPQSPNPLVETAIEFGLSLGLDIPWETNGQGQIIMNPPSGLIHAKRADRLITRMKALLPGWSLWPEVGLHTADGVKAPDLAAASPEFVENVDARGFLTAAPEICVEIMSPSNSDEEMRHKTLLYLAAGAREVWICDREGRLCFHTGAGETGASGLAPNMPSLID